MNLETVLNPEYGLGPEEQEIVEFAIENQLHVPFTNFGNLVNFWIIGTHYGAFFKYRLTIDKGNCLATLRRVPRVINTIEEARQALA